MFVYITNTILSYLHSVVNEWMESSGSEFRSNRSLLSQRKHYLHLIESVVSARVTDRAGLS